MKMNKYVFLNGLQSSFQYKNCLHESLKIYAFATSTGKMIHWGLQELI